MRTQTRCLVTALLTSTLIAGAVGASEVAGGKDWQKVKSVVATLAGQQSEGGGVLLPPGAKVDNVEWDQGVLEIHLTVPNKQDWQLQPLEMSALSHALASPFASDDFAGVSLKLRRGEKGEYGSLEETAFLKQSEHEAVEVIEPEGGLVPELQLSNTQIDNRTRVGGPVSHGSAQPAGALSGVTVFVSAGHGWTAGDASWILQRAGDLQNMNEDYGNIDQLNYFAHYAFNAGATVVPFRPVGWQPIEIVLDNDDPGVTYTGTWSNGSASKYYENGVTSSGVIYRAVAAAATETHTARYTPTIATSGYYPVYTWVLASTNRTMQKYRIAHSGGLSEVVVDHRLVGNGWVWLGEYYFESGGTNYVEISNESSAGGYVIADAIRFGCGMGDVSRPGPDSVSGYPRDEECARYWAHSELGNNAVGFTASSIWDASSSDKNDNVSTAARWAREMNQTGYNNDRWRRVYYEFHSNALDTTARGCIALITDLGATTYQSQFATYVSNEIDADMAIFDADFEHTWYDRSSPTYTGSYGAIATGANGNEFDATIVEVGYHDNATDAHLLRDCRVRAALAKSSVQAIIRFLNSLPSSTVPLAFPPDTPRTVRAVDAGGGNVSLSWQAPLYDSAHGDAATGYVIYESTNGYGFGNPTVVGNVLTASVSGLALGDTKYYRIAATNAGGESMPSEVLAVRRAGASGKEVLIVNSFDRLQRSQNFAQQFTFPPAYNGLTPERQMWRKSNSYDYVIQYAEALAACGLGFSSCDNESVASGLMTLDDFDALMWISGEESTSTDTFDVDEQDEIEAYLNGGGNLLVSGAEIGWDLDSQGTTADRTFYNSYLKTDYSSDDAGTYDVTPITGSIFDGLSSFSFDDGTIFYDSQYPDVVTTSGGSSAALNYSGGSGGVAGVVFDGTFKVVSFGFPFEMIDSASDREDVMLRIAEFFFPGVICDDASDCDDGLYCNGAEVCDSNVCHSGTAVDCSDSVNCTTDSCNESTDSCDNIPNNAYCDNGLFCDGSETCNETQGCLSGSDPCPGQDCDEINDECINNQPQVVYEWNMNTNPGWTTSGSWAWGQPTGGGGQHGDPDPTAGYTGDYVYGYNLSGDYQNSLSETHLTTAAINCSALTDVNLSFRRWLGVEQPSYDHAYLRISNNGTSWTTIWQNTAEINDGAWVPQEFDISSVADGESTVYIRWTMGSTDGSWQYCGWNVDDVVITAIVADPECEDNEDCDDGLYCNGAETCNGISCVAGSDPCPGQGCDESTDSCVGSQLIYSWDMSTNPGWTEQGNWDYGQPSGGGGDHGSPDPTSGYTGSYVYGYDLSGDYENNMAETHLTTTAIDCSDLTSVTLKFRRWLGVEQPTYDHTYLRVSNNGSTWTTVWQNTAEVAESAWSLQEYDISSVADQQSTVYIRWTVGPTDSSWIYCGWNIDDVQIWGYE